jgi:hypothetical protein
MNTLGMGSPHSLANLELVHPSLEESNLLFKLFFENVNPFIRALHQSHFGKELEKYRRGTLLTPRDFEALIFSIYVLTINSLRPETIQDIFVLTKEDLLAQYKHLAHVALARVNFFKSDKLHTLSALLHYLVCHPN